MGVINKKGGVFWCKGWREGLIESWNKGVIRKGNLKYIEVRMRPIYYNFT